MEEFNQLKVELNKKKNEYYGKTKKTKQLNKLDYDTFVRKCEEMKKNIVSISDIKNYILCE